MTDVSTYFEFKARVLQSESRVPLRRRIRTVWGLALALRLRVPDSCGFFGPDAVGARWCWPWQWYRLYYTARYGKA
jgi:hypothetical protein